MERLLRISNARRRRRKVVFVRPDRMGKGVSLCMQIIGCAAARRIHSDVRRSVDYRLGRDVLADDRTKSRFAIAFSTSPIVI